MLQSIKENYDDVSWWRSRAIPYAVMRLYRRKEMLAALTTSDGAFQSTNFMAEDWDTLVILDGCRHDLYAEVTGLPGDLETRYSPASSTANFLRRTFRDATFTDTVYVSASPMYAAPERVGCDVRDRFHAVVPVWKDRWNSEYGTVTPETMTAAVIEAHERFPERRILAHYMQPHYPFIGEWAQEHLPNHKGSEVSRSSALGDSASHSLPNIWNLLQQGDVTETAVWKAYRENLETVLAELPPLLDHVDGRVVVTSDHGNLLKERVGPLRLSISGHGNGIADERLRKVPWHVVQTGPRRTTKSSDPEESTASNRADVENRLSDLGYVT